jgi:hypothetical protein
MTEQPAEPVTEQEWLQNDATTARPIDPDELRVRAAHRVTTAKLTPPTQLHPAPVIALARPFEVAEATVLLRKSVTATAKLQLARKAAAVAVAEDVLKEALAAEGLAEIHAGNAETALLEFIREAADQ